GYQKFRTEVFPRKQELYQNLARGQAPHYLFVTCSDSRVFPQEFTGAGVGDLFIDRCLGNIIPEPGRGETETEAIAEDTVVALGVKHIIICGHSNCGAMKGLLHPEALANMPTVAAWLKNARETLEAVRRKHPHLQGEALLEATVRENVLVMLDRLKRTPCVA